MNRNSMILMAEDTALKFVAPVGFASGIMAFVYNFGVPQLPLFGDFHSIVFPIIVSIFLTIILIKWLIPVLPKPFYINSYIMAFLFAVIEFLNAVVHYFNQTSMEMSFFLITCAWILIFLRNLEFASLNLENDG